eukprot:XP_028336326.1 proline-rich protein 2-like [Physeter catodon]
MLAGQTASWHLPGPTRGCPAGPALLRLQELRLPPRGPRAPRLTGAELPAWKKGDRPGQKERTAVSGAGPRLRTPSPPSLPAPAEPPPCEGLGSPAGRAAGTFRPGVPAPPGRTSATGSKLQARPRSPAVAARSAPASRGDPPSPQSRAAGVAVRLPSHRSPGRGRDAAPVTPPAPGDRQRPRYTLRPRSGRLRPLLLLRVPPSPQGGHRSQVVTRSPPGLRAHSHPRRGAPATGPQRPRRPVRVPPPGSSRPPPGLDTATEPRGGPRGPVADKKLRGPLAV